MKSMTMLGLTVLALSMAGLQAKTPMEIANEIPMPISIVFLARPS